MHEIAASHPTLRCGVPHFREKRYIPIRRNKRSSGVKWWMAGQPKK